MSLPIAVVRAPNVPGRIGFSPFPGGRVDEIVGWGARLVVSLVEEPEFVALGAPGLGEEMRARGLVWRHLPIADFSAPDDAFEARWIEAGREIRACLRAGGDVLAHCRGGLGRSGMIAARLLVELGERPEAAMAEVRRARPGAIETAAQEEAVRRALDRRADDAA